MITGPDYVISARMGTREPELVLDIYPRRGYTWCMGATETAKFAEIDQHFKLWDERAVIDAIEAIVESPEMTDDAQRIRLVRMVLERASALINGEADDGEFVEDEPAVPAADPAQVDELIREHEIYFGEE